MVGTFYCDGYKYQVRHYGTGTYGLYWCTDGFDELLLVGSEDQINQALQEMQVFYERKESNWG